MTQSKKNFLWNTIGTTFNSFLSLFLLIAITRINGLETAGDFSFIYTSSLILQLISNFGGRVYQVSDIKNEFSFQDYLGSRIKASGISLLATAIYSIIFKIKIKLIILLIFFMVFRIIETFSDVFYGEFQKKEHLDYVGISLTLKSVFLLITFLIVDLYTNNIYISTFSMLISTLMVFLLYDIHKIKKIKKLYVTFNNKVYAKSKYIFLFSLLTIILLNVPRFIANYTLSSVETGYLGILLMIPTVMSLICQFIIQPNIVKITKLINDKDIKEFNSLVLKCNLSLFLFSLACILLAITLGASVLKILYGVSFESYKVSFVVLIISGMFNGFTTIFSNILTVFRETKKQFSLYAVVLIFNIVICKILATNYGLNGLFIGSMISMITQYILFYLLYRKYKKRIFSETDLQKIKCIFISNIISEDVPDLKEINTISYADNLAQLELAQRLHEEYKDDLIIISAAYNDRKNYNHKAEITYARGMKIFGIKNCSKNKIIYYLTIIYGYYKELIKQLKQINNEKVIVITSGPHVFRTIPVLLARNQYSYKFIPFLIGSVELPQYKGIYGLIAKASKYILKYADGTISYVAKNSIDYTTKPYVSILYSISEADKKISNQIYKKNRRNRKNKTILFAGALTSINSLNNIIDIIKNIPPNYKFIVCGNGEYREELEKLAKMIPNKLSFLGNVSHDEVIKLEHESDYLIVLRDTSSKVGKVYARYALSSKLFEYLLSGTPIIVNDHDAIPCEIRKYLNLIDNEDYKCVLDFLEKNDRNIDKLYEKSHDGRNYIIKNANYKVQGDKVIDFLREI